MQPDSNFDPRQAAKKLLREGRSGALATLMPGSGDPYCSLVNVATAIDGAPLLLLSTLAVHTKNLLADPRVSLMLDERKDGDPLEGARVMLMGTMAAPTGDPAARVAYLRRHPEAEMFVGFADFAFYRMDISRAHLVAGFGRIVDLKAADVLTDTSDAAALAEAEADAIAHMNADHAEACRLYATKLLGAPDGAWTCVGIDPEGLELQQGRLTLRLPFAQRVAGPRPLRQMLKQLAEQARAG
jgi:putative heme iron utilization protein